MSSAAAEGDPGPLFEEYRRTRSRELRNRLVEMHRGMVEVHVRRYEGRGIATADLRQVALLGLLHAVERFDPEVGASFSTFAGRTVDGELKRQLRDRSWSVRPPRSTQERYLEVGRAREELTQQLQRAPTVAEIARQLGTDEDHVLEALEAGGARRAASLDHRPGDDDEAPAPVHALASTEVGYGAVDRRMLLREVLADLDERERMVIELRFVEELSQEEIAARIGVSQSYLSRLLRRTLLQLRERLEG